MIKAIECVRFSVRESRHLPPDDEPFATWTVLGYPENSTKPIPIQDCHTEEIANSIVNSLNIIAS